MQHQFGEKSTTTEALFPEAESLGRIKGEVLNMNEHDDMIRSGIAAVYFFTAVSSIAAIATALLPFILQH